VNDFSKLLYRNLPVGDIFCDLIQTGALGALLRLFFLVIKINLYLDRLWSLRWRLFARFFLLVETSAILISEVRLTPRARVSSFNSLKSFSSIDEYDE
jgi:hypothetical protein